jgi:hypothetical protein
MNKKIKVKDHPNLVRDPNNNAIVSTDKRGYQKYIAEREEKISKNNKIAELEKRLAYLEKVLLER